MPTPSEPPKRSWYVARAYGVHLFTASGILCALAATMELFHERPDPRVVFGWLALAVLIDSVDGLLARRWRVKHWASQIDGRTIDDIVDYFTFTFVPLLMVWRLQWAPWPAALWIAIPLLASLLGFANVAAKQEQAGFFRGFPSYWNIAAFYIGLADAHLSKWWSAAALIALAVLTVLPVRFIYPNLAPPPWHRMVQLGAFGWFALLVAMLPDYPQSPVWIIALSLVYPLFYVALSLHLDRKARRDEALHPRSMA
jgi:phosphatidylcholine synthase